VSARIRQSDCVSHTRIEKNLFETGIALLYPRPRQANPTFVTKSNSFERAIAPEEVRQKLKVAVVDIDDTLLVGSRASHFFWWLSLQFQRIGRRLQKANSSLIPKLSGYDRVIVLTGRDAKESQFTESQLKKAGVSFSSLLCCPRKKIITEWKTATVTHLGDTDKIVWIDDIFESGLPEILKSKFPSNLTIMAPETAKVTNIERSSELEWL